MPYSRFPDQCLHRLHLNKFQRNVVDALLYSMAIFLAPMRVQHLCLLCVCNPGKRPHPQIGQYPQRIQFQPVIIADPFCILWEFHSFWDLPKACAIIKFSEHSVAQT